MNSCTENQKCEKFCPSTNFWLIQALPNRAQSKKMTNISPNIDLKYLDCYCGQRCMMYTQGV